MRRRLAILAGWVRSVLGYAEPVRLRAVGTSAAGLLFALGLTSQTTLPGEVDTLISAWATLLPLLQGWATRRKVTAAAKIDTQLAHAHLSGLISPMTYDRLREQLVTGAQPARGP